MMSQILAQTNLTIFARVSLVLFLFIYLVVLWRAFHPKYKERHEEMSKLIFKEDQE